MSKLVGTGFEAGSVGGPSAGAQGASRSEERPDMTLVVPDTGVCTCGCLYRYHSISVPHACVRCIVLRGEAGLRKCPAYCPAIVMTRKKLSEIRAAWTGVQVENDLKEWILDDSARGIITATDEYGDKFALISVLVHAPKLALFLSGLQETMEFLLDSLHSEVYDITDQDLADREDSRLGVVEGAQPVAHDDPNDPNAGNIECPSCGWFQPTYCFLSQCVHHAEGCPNFFGVAFYNDQGRRIGGFQSGLEPDKARATPGPGGVSLWLACSEFVGLDPMNCIGRCLICGVQYIYHWHDPLTESHEFIGTNLASPRSGPCKVCGEHLCSIVHT